jgi:hypothetical protein
MSPTLAGDTLRVLHLALAEFLLDEKMPYLDVS